MQTVVTFNKGLPPIDRKYMLSKAKKWTNYFDMSQSCLTFTYFQILNFRISEGFELGTSDWKSSTLTTRPTTAPTTLPLKVQFCSIDQVRNWNLFLCLPCFKERNMNQRSHNSVSILCLYDVPWSTLVGKGREQKGLL